jgi:AraC family transcriptional regulator
MTTGVADFDPKEGTIHPFAWRDWADAPDSFSSAPRMLPGTIIQRWAGSSREMRQPPLNHHNIAVHLGGPKRVTRRGGMGALTEDVKTYAYTTIEAGTNYHWSTEGPIAFAHVYLEPEFYASEVGAALDRDPASVRFLEQVGAFDPLIARLLIAVISSAERDDAATMALETQIQTLMVKMCEKHMNMPQGDGPLLLAPRAIARVREYVAAHLGGPITLDDLAEQAGYSRYHFARGFRAATGVPPYAYIVRERIALACQLLGQREVPISAIAAATGFASHAQFSSRFRQMTGLAPSAFRDLLL